MKAKDNQSTYTLKKVKNTYCIDFIDDMPVSTGKKVHLIVHNGKFHADDVFSVALLVHVLWAFADKSAKEVPISTIQPAVIDRVPIEDLEPLLAEIEEKDERYIVADIGCGEFDHHQEGSPVREGENGIPYAAFGLIWKKWGHLIIDNAELCEEFDRTFVQVLDAHANGISTNPLSITISAMNPGWGTEQTIDMRFDLARRFASKILYDNIISYQSKLDARDIVMNAPVEDRVLILDRDVPYKMWTKGSDEIDYVIYPNTGNAEWCVGTILDCDDTTGFRSKFLLPKIWTYNPISGMTYCHKARFVASFKTKEQALSAAKWASVIARKDFTAYVEAYKKKARFMPPSNSGIDLLSELRLGDIRTDVSINPVTSNACEAMGMDTD